MKRPDSAPERDAADGAAAVDWAVGAGAGARVVAEVAAALLRRRRRRLALAAGLCVLGGAAGAMWLRPPAPAERPGRAPVVVTLAATRTLPDGTTVDLKDGADLAVDFSGPLRRVTLRSGEAHFEVAKDPLRPFVVSAGGVEARAVGTAFAVELRGDHVDVLVTEGRVAVEHPAPPAQPLAPPPAALLDAGHRLVVARAPDPAAPLPAVETVSPLAVHERLAWRAPRLDLAGTPLADVIPVLERHSRTRIVLADPALGRLQVSGFIRADSVDALLRVLELEFRLRAERRSATEVVLRRQ